MSDENLEDPTAVPEDVPEPTMAQMTADLVRDRTKSEAKLTPVNALAYEGNMLTPSRREQLIEEIQADESCADIKVLRTSKGDAFLYSTASMSDTYARILLRVEEGNPYETIAGTVREESETYPRPTPVESLKAPVFGLDSEKVESYAREMAQLPEYADVKLIVASTGALYLYSERHLSKEHAESLVEWEEVGRHQSL